MLLNLQYAKEALSNTLGWRFWHGMLPAGKSDSPAVILEGSKDERKWKETLLFQQCFEKVFQVILICLISSAFKNYWSDHTI